MPSWLIFALRTSRSA